MEKKNKKIISYLIAITLILFLSAGFFVQKSNYSILTTSVLTMLRGIADEYAPQPPDLEIENVALIKKGSPTESLNYYKYSATIIIHNNGGNLANARVVLNGGENQKSVVVKNTDAGFSLKAGESYIIRDYDMLFDGDYNVGKTEVSIEVVDKVDIDLSNNSFETIFYEETPQVTGISLKEVLDDGTFVLDFDDSNYLNDRHIYELNFAKGEDVKGEMRFVETSKDEDIVQYSRIKNSLKTLEQDFNVNKTTEIDSHFLELDYDPFLEKEPTYVYLKIINPVNGYYAFSNILAFNREETFTRGEFAKLFADYTKLETNDSGFSYFTDVSEEDENYPYIQTLYNEGLLDTTRTSYKPLNIMSRGEVLSTVIDYYDVDLKIGKESPHFEDVLEDSQYFPYAETLYLTGGASAFSQFLAPNKPATKSYLKYLINEYS